MEVQSNLFGEVTPGTHKNWLLKTGDPLIQVHLHCILVEGTPKNRLLNTGDHLISDPLRQV